MTDQTNAATPAPPPKPKAHSPRLPYLPALDGLRALAVIAVLFYHAELQWMPGGFLGVEIFFTISGYLIASLLLSEWHETGRIVLKQFWLRRARRLLPALFAVIIGVLAFSVIFLPDEVAGLRSDALAAFGYSTNWYLIFSNKSYFEAVGRPSMLQHLWSLAVEEQFYVFWPLAFTLTMRRWRERSVLIGVIVVALASALLMGLLYQPDMDPSRVYYGTDTRAAGILIGVALAFVWSPGRSGGRAARLPLDLIGFAALGVLLLCCLMITEFEPFLYRGGFAVVALSTATLVAASVHRKSRILQAVLGFSVLRWVGLRSYGIYLWHWPVFMLTRPQLDTSLDGLPLLALRFGLTLILAELSFRLVETPVRSGAIGRSWQTLQRSEGRQRRQLIWRWASAATAILLASVVLGSSVVRAQPPPPPAYLVAPAAPSEVQTQAQTAPFNEGGQRPPPPPTAAEPPPPTETPICAALAATAAPIATPDQAPTASPTAERAADIATATPTSMATETPPAAAAPTTSPTDDAAERVTAARRTAVVITTPTPAAAAVISGTTPGGATIVTPTVTTAFTAPITALGDSVMQGAAPALYQTFPGIEVDAEKGRQVYRPPVDFLIAQLQDGRTSGRLGQIVILHLGNNGFYPKESFDRIMQTLADRRLVIVLNVRVPRQWEDNNNRVITEGIKRYPNAVLVDWNALTDKRPELFWNDGHHLRPEGAEFYAALIQKTINANLSKLPAP